MDRRMEARAQLSIHEGAGTGLRARAKHGKSAPFRRCRGAFRAIAAEWRRQTGRV